MNRWARASLMSLLAVLVGLMVRSSFVSARSFDHDDLDRYERQPYGVDLPDWYRSYPLLLAWTRGDGQAFMTIAGDPLAQDSTLGLGAPAYRMSRVGYSVISRALVGWREDLIPIGLFTANLAAIGGLGWIAGWKSIDWGPRSVLIPFNPAVLIGITADTAEVLGVLFLTVSMISKRRWISLGTGALLGATRPSFATSLPAGSYGPIASVAAIAAASVIQVWLVVVKGLGWGGSSGNLTLPFLGYVSAWTEMGFEARITCIAVVLAAVSTLAMAMLPGGLRRRVAFAATGLLALSLGPGVVLAPVNLLRAVGALAVLWIIPDHAIAKHGQEALN